MFNSCFSSPHQPFQHSHQHLADAAVKLVQAARKSLWLLYTLLILVVISGAAVDRAAAEEPKLWKAGISRAVITPETPVWLAGYGSRRAPDGKLHELWMKALALQDSDGRTCVLVTSDFQGIPRSVSDQVFDRVQREYGLERRQVMLTFSHNHCGPRLGDDLIDYYPVEAEQEALVAEYSQLMVARMAGMIGEALKSLQPATVQTHQGTATFAVNRRNNREADIPSLLASGTPLVGPVDHSVPVLSVKDSAGALKAILFGYACHPTTLSFTQWCGDYPGFAQLELEQEHPGVTAMFVNTCGGDQNPLPRRTVELCQDYGHQLAQAVEAALMQPGQTIVSELQTSFQMVDLPYLSVMTDQDLLQAAQDTNAIKARWAARLLQKLQQGETFEPAYPYPIHVWRLGKETLMIGMGAETVVDYALRFKEQFGEQTWVCGYADDMIAYIPSRRVWEEGGYEGGSNLYEYGRPALRWAGDIEDRIAAVVQNLVSTLDADASEPKIADWVRVTEAAEWKPRDSSGELVFKDQLWILGGWFDSYSPPPRDVWSSPDGKHWSLVNSEAPWKYSDLPMTVTFKDRMWIMGGWYNGRLEGHGATNEIWSSADGKQWDLVTEKAEWSPRLAAGAVVFKDRMWILGGSENYYFGDYSSLKNDVWSSADGTTWELATDNAPWSPRAYHQAVVHDGKIWVMGGGNYVPEYHALNDVWCSTDGINWEKVTALAPWSPRLWFSAMSWRDHLWVVGGWSNNPSRNWGDLWYSKDGRTWTQLKSNVVWKERHEHSAFVFQDKMWIAAGHAQPLSNEVWMLELPQDFFEPTRKQ